jgi:hypothetical protein
MIFPNHVMVQQNHDPLYIKWLEQIHRIDGSPRAIPVDPDLL